MEPCLPFSCKLTSHLVGIGNSFAPAAKKMAARIQQNHANVRFIVKICNSIRLIGKKIGLVGFEPTASSSRTRRSTKLSHSPDLQH